MANDATMTVKAVFLPDEIQKTLENQTMTFSPGVAVLKWWFGMVNVISSSTDLIPAGSQPLGTSSASAKSADAGTSVDTVESAAADEVKFLLIKNLGVIQDGSTSTTHSVYLTNEGTAPNNGSGTYVAQAIEVGAGEIWYAKMNCQLQNIQCRTGPAGFSGSSGVKVQCLVAAVIDTT